MSAKYSRIPFYVCLLVCSTMIIPVESAQLLQNDPFKQPELTPLSKKVFASDTRAVREVWLPQLRATMRAGQRSMANIDGEIIKIGEKINGFELVEVHERDAFFVKNGVKYHVSMDQEPDNIMEE